MPHDYRVIITDSKENQWETCACNIESIEKLADILSHELDQPGEYADAIDYEDEDEETEYTIYYDGSCDVRHVQNDAGYYSEPVQVVPPRPLDIHIYCYPAGFHKVHNRNRTEKDFDTSVEEYVDDDFDYELVSDDLDDAKAMAREFFAQHPRPADPDRGDFWQLIAYDENDPHARRDDRRLFEMDNYFDVANAREES